MTGNRYLRILMSASVILVFGSAWQPVQADELRDYGEHLSGECITCHRLNADYKGIPPIFGWEIETFVSVMNAYRKGLLTNKAMVSVAKSLDDEQIKALATYFKTVKRPKKKK